MQPHSEELTGLDVAIKWPNDLTVKKKKLCGILTDLKTEQNKIVFAVLGIGINVNADIDRFPDEVKSIATSLKNETGILYSRAEIAAEVLNEIDRWYKTLKAMDRDTLLSAWRTVVVNARQRSQCSDKPGYIQRPGPGHRQRRSADNGTTDR